VADPDGPGRDSLGERLTVAALDGDDWATFRDVRMRSLLDSPDAFAATPEDEAGQDEADWRLRLDDDKWCTAMMAGHPVGLMGVAAIDRHGCDCWLHGCWVDPDVRRMGVTRRLLGWLDDVSRERHWRRQGLGVWPDNTDAIAAWERLGFTSLGAPLPSARRPGMRYLAMLRDVPARPSP
jgi:GNAT superfamily N-acetyltransferase